MSHSVRHEEPPDDMVVVVRGGLAAADSIRRTAEVSQATQGFFGVSVFLVFDMSIEDLVGQVPELSPDRYRQLRTTTVGALRTARFGLLLPATGRTTTSCSPTLRMRRSSGCRAAWVRPSLIRRSARQWVSHDLGSLD